MKIPDKLKIGGRWVPVLRMLSTEMGGEMATYSNWTGIIKITNCPEQHPQQEDVSLLHEIIECLDKRFQYELKHPIIQGLAENLYQVLRDNDLDFRGK